MLDPSACNSSKAMRWNFQSNTSKISIKQNCSYYPRSSTFLLVYSSCAMRVYSIVLMFDMCVECWIAKIALTTTTDKITAVNRLSNCSSLPTLFLVSLIYVLWLRNTVLGSCACERDYIGF